MYNALLNAYASFYSLDKHVKDSTAEMFST